MNKENQKKIEDEILEEEYKLGNEYYNELIKKAKEENNKYR